MKKQEKKTNKIRLNKYLSLCGVGSRRTCDDYIEQGLIRVNGEVCREFGCRVDNNDTVEFRNKIVKPEEIVYVALNKPVGVVTTLDDPEGRPTVADYFKNLPFIKPVGRLDYNTSGILILTNDGNLHYKLTHPKFQIPKLYHVTAKGRVDNDILDTIKQGVRLDDGKVATGLIKEMTYSKGKTEIILELREGINREIRRIFEKLNYQVLSLDRIEFAGIKKSPLKIGEWRYLSKNEIAQLYKY